MAKSDKQIMGDSIDALIYENEKLIKAVKELKDAKKEASEAISENMELKRQIDILKSQLEFEKEKRAPSEVWGGDKEHKGFNRKDYQGGKGYESYLYDDWSYDPDRDSQDWSYYPKRRTYRPYYPWPRCPQVGDYPTPPLPDDFGPYPFPWWGIYPPEWNWGRRYDVNTVSTNSTKDFRSDNVTVVSDSEYGDTYEEYLRYCHDTNGDPYSEKEWRKLVLGEADSSEEEK